MSNARINLFWLIIFGVTLPLSVLLSTHLARQTFEKVKLRDQTITVKGYAERAITSDLAQWSVSLIARQEALAPASQALSEARRTFVQFMADKGFTESALAWSPVSIETLHPRDKEGHRLNQIEGYVLRQRISVQTPRIQEIAAAARDVSKLLEQGIELESDTPQFICTKLDDYKLQMLAEATRNARQRAETLVSHSTSRLGSLRSASQGVFQITPVHSADVSDSGMNDQSTIAKTIKAVVTVEYAIE